MFTFSHISLSFKYVSCHKTVFLSNVSLDQGIHVHDKNKTEIRR